MYNLALDFQERSQASEARLIDQFEESVARLSGRLGDLIIVDDEDERLVLSATGRFRAEVLPEDTNGQWRELTEPEDIVEFYDPTDVFGDLADALAEAFPSVAPDARGRGGTRRRGRRPRSTSRSKRRRRGPERRHATTNGSGPSR